MTQIRTNSQYGDFSNSVFESSVTESKIVPGAVVPRHIAVDRGAVRTEAFMYTFAASGSAAAQGGAQGAITLTDLDGTALTLPAKALINTAHIECVTAATSGGAATVALGITGNTDCFIAATAYTDNKFDTANNYAALTNELPLKVGTSAVSVIATIADADLTAGKFIVRVSYSVGL